jgi:hypothetical protein
MMMPDDCMRTRRMLQDRRSVVLRTSTADHTTKGGRSAPACDGSVFPRVNTLRTHAHHPSPVGSAAQCYELLLPDSVLSSVRDHDQAFQRQHRRRAARTSSEVGRPVAGQTRLQPIPCAQPFINTDVLQSASLRLAGRVGTMTSACFVPLVSSSPCFRT